VGIYIHPTQTSRCSSKTSRYDLYKCGIAAPTRDSIAAKIRVTAAALKNNTGHLTENTITFYSKLHFQ
jgi:hypothetical protein